MGVLAGVVVGLPGLAVGVLAFGNCPEDAVATGLADGAVLVELAGGPSGVPEHPAMTSRATPTSAANKCCFTSPPPVTQAAVRETVQK